MATSSKATLALQPMLERRYADLIRSVAHQKHGGAADFVGRSELAEYLQSLRSSSDQPLTEIGVLPRLFQRYPLMKIGSKELVLLSLIDECMQALLERAALDPKVEQLIAELMPALAVETLQTGARSFLGGSKVLQVIQQVCDLCHGWSSNLGRLGDIFLAKLLAQFSIRSDLELTPELMLERVLAFAELERVRISNRETVMRQEEKARLEAERIRAEVTQIVNSEMLGRQYSFGIVLMLQGAWVALLQAVRALNKDKAWDTALKATRSASRWLDLSPLKQPSADELREASVALSDVVRKLARQCQGLDKIAETICGDLEGDFTLRIQGQAPPPMEFSPLGVELRDRIDRGELEQLNPEAAALAPGQWFLYRDASGLPTRLKLLMVWDDEELVFTDHNHKSARPISYPVFVRHHANGGVQRLYPLESCATFIRDYITSLMRHHEEMLRREQGGAGTQPTITGDAKPGFGVPANAREQVGAATDSGAAAGVAAPPSSPVVHGLAVAVPGVDTGAVTAAAPAAAPAAADAAAPAAVTEEAESVPPGEPAGTAQPSPPIAAVTPQEPSAEAASPAAAGAKIPARDAAVGVDTQSAVPAGVPPAAAPASHHLQPAAPATDWTLPAGVPDGIPAPEGGHLAVGWAPKPGSPAAEYEENRRREERRQVVSRTTDLVVSLNVGALVNLPFKGGGQGDCKLVAKVASTQNFIFVNDRKVKVAEYHAEELIELLLTKQMKVIRNGTNFEDTLASVVIGLRQDREKFEQGFIADKPEEEGLASGA